MIQPPLITVLDEPHALLPLLGLNSDEAKSGTVGSGNSTSWKTNLKDLTMYVCMYYLCIRFIRYIIRRLSVTLH